VKAIYLRTAWAVGILLNKEKNIFDGVIDVESQRVNYVGGYVEGFDVFIIEVIVTNDIRTEIMPIINESTDDGIPTIIYKTVFKDKDGLELENGDALPIGLINIKAQFTKPDQDHRIADLELVIAELMNN